MQVSCLWTSLPSQKNVVWLFKLLLCLIQANVPQLKDVHLVCDHFQFLFYKSGSTFLFGEKLQLGKGFAGSFLQFCDDFHQYLQMSPISWFVVCQVFCFIGFGFGLAFRFVSLPDLESFVLSIPHLGNVGKADVIISRQVINSALSCLVTGEAAAIPNRDPWSRLPSQLVAKDPEKFGMRSPLGFKPQQ